MKLKISEIKPNPFKKEINEGKLNQEQIDKLKANINELGLMGAIPVVKIAETYHAVCGHHRLAAMKEVYGKDHEVDVTVHKYNDDQLMRGMIIENMSQRADDFHEVKENIIAVEKYLNERPTVLSSLRASRNVATARCKQKEMEKAVSHDIAAWIDGDTGKVVSHDTITDYLNIAKKVDGNIQKMITYNSNKKPEEREDEHSINFTQAKMLSRIDDKAEQRDLLKVIKNTREQATRKQSSLINAYKEAPEEIKAKVRKGELDLADVPIESSIANNLNGIGKATKELNKTPADYVVKMQDILGELSRYANVQVLPLLTESQKKLIWIAWKGNASDYFKELSKEVFV